MASKSVSWRNVADRAAVTSRRLLARLSRPVGADAPPVWTAPMLWLVFAGCIATVVAGIADPVVHPHAVQSTNPFLRLLVDITDVAQSGWYIVPAIIVVAVLGLLDWGAVRHASRRKLLNIYGQAFYILASIAIPGIITNIIKQFVGRARPHIAGEAGVFGFSPFEFDAVYQSFPSGHATTAGSLAVILMIWYPRWRHVVFALMVLLASARLPAGAHYPSDVVAGFSLGFVVSLAIARWLARRRTVFRFRQSALFPVLLV